jgi:hypothetical protein
LSNVARKRPPGAKGYDSPTSRRAPVAFGVKMQAYSSGEAPKYASTAARARSTRTVDADDVGLTEWGLPRTESRSSAMCSSSCDSA